MCLRKVKPLNASGFTVCMILIQLYDTYSQRKKQQILKEKTQQILKENIVPYAKTLFKVTHGLSGI